MLKSIVWQSYRHMSTATSVNVMTSIKTANSYRITFSDPKTRYVLNTILITSKMLDLSRNYIRYKRSKIILFN